MHRFFLHTPVKIQLSRNSFLYIEYLNLNIFLYLSTNLTDSFMIVLSAWNWTYARHLIKIHIRRELYIAISKAANCIEIHSTGLWARWLWTRRKYVEWIRGRQVRDVRRRHPTPQERVQHVSMSHAVTIKRQQILHIFLWFVIYLSI